MNNQSKPSIKLGLSPCPNDTYIFYHLLKNGLSHYSIEPVFADVQELNERALNNAELPISKVSCYAAALQTEHYEILPSGGALGHNCGPLLVSNQNYESTDQLISDLKKADRILIPGKTTTAHLLLRLFLHSYGIEHPNVEPIIYSDILPSLKRGEANFGLIIHEERFTYPSYQVFAPIDLGQWWEETTDLPIPLGCILIRKDYMSIFEELDKAIKQSIDYSKANLNKAWPFIKENAQTIEDSAIRSHIDLYVTDYSREPGEIGKAAFARLRQEAAKLKL
ncbi:MAG: 1,4-dihydroxy-6-naphthoate synthase [Leptonema sp. (in: Bacteria)]|nr:1,4-dihydroxy-6-naphthoate synthase [Leptonema sp. (in: bacteria)]